MKSLSLLHPFSAQAIGLEESDLYFSHSKPHENALQELKNDGYLVSVDYFTGKLYLYKKKISGIKKVFWPITTPLLSTRHVWRRQHSFIHLFKNWISPPDLTLINMSGHGSKYIFKLAKLLRKKQKPYVAMIGGMNVSTSGEALNYYKNAHHIIVHTQIQKNSLKQQKGFNKLIINVIPLGVDILKFKPIKVKSRENELLFVGRITPLKQIEKAIEALNYMVNIKKSNARLNVIGPMSDIAYYRELKTLVSFYKLNEKVNFLGVLNQEDIIPFYQNASVLLLPSKHESFGMVMVEAMACGTPVIALKGAGGPDEIIEDGINGYICSNNNYNTKVFELLRSKPLLLKFQTNSRNIVIRKWNLDHTINCFRKSVECVLEY